LRKKHESQLNFTAQVKGGKKHHNYCLPSGHPLVLAFEISAKFPHFLNDEEFKAAQEEDPNISQDTFLLPVLKSLPTIHKSIL
jgi:hypothetical protein